MENTEHPSFLVRHEFLIRRLHSLSGLIPVGAYMVVHLLTNATIVNGPATFQKSVYSIHSLGVLLPVVEWGFIFLPILFHAIIGVVIIQGGLPNSSTYPLSSNIRYTLQRATGMIAFFFILWHVFHMHGWFHFEWWERWIEPLHGGRFSPFNAASTAAEAIQASWVVIALYTLGMLACVFHLANGLWTMGITWGLWISSAAQRRASWVCLVFGVLLAAVGLSSVVGFSKQSVPAAREIEAKQWQARVEAGELNEQEHSHKRATEARESTTSVATPAAAAESADEPSDNNASRS